VDQVQANCNAHCRLSGYFHLWHLTPMARLSAPTGSFWGLRTQPSKARGQSPFFLVYESEAILPADVMWKSPWLEIFEEGKADTARHLKLDSAEEIRCNASLQSARYLQRVRRYHDRNVQWWSFNVGDMVLRWI
jgi:hypothetical protein